MIVHEPPAAHPHAPLKVALLSGASNPRTCGLSPSQVRFMDRLELPSSCKVLMNFPYLPEHRQFEDLPPLWLASWRNLRQFAGASRPDFRTSAARHIQALIDSCDRMLVITLSCGLEILNGSLAVLGPIDSLHAVALGPVAWHRPPVPHTLVQGTRDPISRLFFRDVETRLDRVGHMNYLEQASVMDLVNTYVSQHLCGNTSASQEQACTCRPSP